MHWPEEMVLRKEAGWAGGGEGSPGVRGEDGRAVCLSVESCLSDSPGWILGAEPGEHTRTLWPYMQSLREMALLACE